MLAVNIKSVTFQVLILKLEEKRFRSEKKVFKIFQV